MDIIGPADAPSHTGPVPQAVTDVVRVGIVVRALQRDRPVSDPVRAQGLSERARPVEVGHVRPAVR